MIINNVIKSAYIVVENAVAQPELTVYVYVV